MRHIISEFIRRNYSCIRKLGAPLTVLGAGAAITGGCAKYYREQNRPILGHDSKYEILLLAIGALLTVVGAIMLLSIALYKRQPFTHEVQVEYKKNNREQAQSIMFCDEGISPNNWLTDSDNTTQLPIIGENSSTIYDVTYNEAYSRQLESNDTARMINSGTP